MSSSLLSKALERIDAANSQDPNQEEYLGVSYPKELLYSQRMTDMLNRFAPDASEVVQIAARSQHICRWQKPRSEYEMNRQGYLTWRKNLYKFHADTCAEILSDVGYDQEDIEQVQSLLLKKQLKRNEQSQLLQDVVCLVFLQFYFAAFAAKHEQDKVISIVQKTWAKMSENGHQAALELPLQDNEKQLVVKALS